MLMNKELGTNLHKLTIPCRLSFTWLGTRRSLEAAHKSQAAATFDADKSYLSASQKLFNTKHPAYAKLTSIKNEITQYHQLNTLPFTEPGVRLLQRKRVNEFVAWMTDTKQHHFIPAIVELNNSMPELINEARGRLGSLFNPHHYPTSIIDHFNFEWDFPNIEPPNYLKELNPEVYEQEKARVAAKLDEAVQLAEAAFIEEFAMLVSNLTERLTPDPSGEKKIFKDSTVNNLREFFDRFKSLSLHSNDELDKLVDEAKGLLGGLDPKDIRKHDALKSAVAKDFQSLQNKLVPLIQKAPRRHIIMPKKENHGAASEAPALVAV